MRDTLAKAAEKFQAHKVVVQQRRLSGVKVKADTCIAVIVKQRGFSSTGISCMVDRF